VTLELAAVEPHQPPLVEAPVRRTRFVVLRALLRSWNGRLGLVLVSTMVIATIVSQFWVPYDPLRPYPGAANKWLGFSKAHWLGTDGSGRDLFSQMLDGAQVSLTVALLSALIAGVVGVGLGVASAVMTRAIGAPLTYLVDIFIAIPTLVLALVLVGTFSGSLLTVAIAIGVGFGVGVARVMRGETLRVLTNDYILAAKSSGVSTWRTVWRHILPNIAPMAIVQLSFIAGLAILAEASLSYLGLTSRNKASWGMAIGELQNTVTVHPGPVIVPGLIVILAVLGFNLLGDALRDMMGTDLTR